MSSMKLDAVCPLYTNITGKWRHDQLPHFMSWGGQVRKSLLQLILQTIEVSFDHIKMIITKTHRFIQHIHVLKWCISFLSDHYRILSPGYGKHKYGQSIEIEKLFFLQFQDFKIIKMIKHVYQKYNFPAVLKLVWVHQFCQLLVIQLWRVRDHHLLLRC